jgi:tRNA modification GTPase
MYTQDETIAAIATPPGEGGVAIVRICGSQALAVAEKIFSGNVRSYASHTLHFGHIVDLQGEVVDDVLLAVMHAPRSYTGEETVEIHCHGGSLITRRVLQTVLSAGARAARPGEFTFRAYMSGKLDLPQAEAVQKLIGAKNELALQAAASQLQGALSKKIVEIQKELLTVCAILEAAVDFPEEGLDFSLLKTVQSSIIATKTYLEKLLLTFHDGKRLHEGLTLCLCGIPNVGKSSLMNALLGKERAIVTDIPGTTRDILEADLMLGNLHVRLVDTAGIREADEVIEQEGIRRTYRAMEEADLILLVCDAERGITFQDEALLGHAPESKTVYIWNKIDTPLSRPTPQQFIPISAKLGTGLDVLRTAIDQKIWRTGPPSKEEVVITELRHKQSLETTLSALTDVLQGLDQKVSPEFISADMRRALSPLGTILGTDITEEVLSAIFSQFCVGK